MAKGLTTRSSASIRGVCFGTFEFEPDISELRKHGLRIMLRGQPIEVLTMLLQHPGEAVTREDLQKRLWPADTYVDFEHSLNAAMKRLRAALGDSADAPRFIETLAGRGYRFIAPLSQPAEVVTPAPQVIAPEQKPDQKPTSAQPTRRSCHSGPSGYRPRAKAGPETNTATAFGFAGSRDRGVRASGPYRHSSPEHTRHSSQSDLFWFDPVSRGTSLGKSFRRSRPGIFRGRND